MNKKQLKLHRDKIDGFIAALEEHGIDYVHVGPGQLWSVKGDKRFHFANRLLGTNRDAKMIVVPVAEWERIRERIDSFLESDKDFDIKVFSLKDGIRMMASYDTIFQSVFSHEELFAFRSFYTKEGNFWCESRESLNTPIGIISVENRTNTLR